MHTSNRLSICNRIFFTFSIAILHIFDIIICVLELEVMEYPRVTEEVQSRSIQQ